MGSRAAPRKILVLVPMLGWADPPMVLCMIFANVFGRDGFRSMVLDASACINMYYNIERKEYNTTQQVFTCICMYVCHCMTELSRIILLEE